MNLQNSSDPKALVQGLDKKGKKDKSPRTNEEIAPDQSFWLAMDYHDFAWCIPDSAGKLEDAPAEEPP